MSIQKSLIAAVIVASSFTMGNANAATYNITSLLPVAPAEGFATPGYFSIDWLSAVADSNATLDFVVKGHNTLDGQNSPAYQDDLTLTINSLFAGMGSFNLGGGGNSSPTFGTGTAFTSNPDGPYFVGQPSGTTTITGVKFNLLAGLNTFKFAYSGHTQGLGDEGWSISSASVTAVPEPETYGMMLMGLGLIGFVAGRRKNQQA